MSVSLRRCGEKNVQRVFSSAQAAVSMTQCAKGWGMPSSLWTFDQDLVRALRRHLHKQLGPAVWVQASQLGILVERHLAREQ